MLTLMKMENSRGEESQHWSSTSSSLWMGDIEPYMTENFIKESFALLGEEVISVKLIKNRLDGSSVGYGFVVFKDRSTAQNALYKLNRRQIPNAPIGKKFKLNTTGTRENFREYSIFVGDLPPGMDDITLLTGFTTRYPSVKSAKVILDNEGQSKGFGFVKFNNEAEFEMALKECHKLPIFGNKRIRVSVAIPRHKYFQRSNHAGQGGGHTSPGLLMPQTTGAQEHVLVPQMYNRVPTEYQQQQQQQQVQQQQQALYCYGCAYNYCGGYHGYQCVSPAFYDANAATNYTYPLAYVEHGFGQQYDVDTMNNLAAAKNEELWTSFYDSMWL